ncbi:MAG: chorismate synthase [Sphingomonadales bacterium]
MASNSFGSVFRITTWGESHGAAIGVVIDGCPAGLPLSVEEINAALARRAPGRSKYTSKRSEADLAEITSGVFEGITTGAPIAIIINNTDADPSKYEPIKTLLRPGHANYTYLEKYGVFDYRGGGRSSARETACRVAAGAVAEKLLAAQGVEIAAYLKSVGPVSAPLLEGKLSEINARTLASPLFCPDEKAGQEMAAAIKDILKKGDSWGGVVEFQAHGLEPGLGDPVYEKLEGKLAAAMMSLPASKGFEIGDGFKAATMTGSEHNDEFVPDGEFITKTNHAGGTLGGISTGLPLVGRVAFKPTSSIRQPQMTIDLDGKAQPFELPKGSRHDPCVAIRAVPVVGAMLALVLADALLMNRSAKL